jgi:hypothetical protein
VSGSNDTLTVHDGFACVIQVKESPPDLLRRALGQVISITGDNVR